MFGQGLNFGGLTGGSAAFDAYYLVVAGGGSGGSNSNSGGAGAGGYRTNYGSTALEILPSTTYNITVGAGGTANAFGSGVNGNNGNNSVFNIITSTGGGAGGAQGQTPGTGGSGGGGGYDRSGSAGNAGGFSPVEGYAGGSGTQSGSYPGGGGGGASEVGNTDGAGHGGDGTSNSITGSAVFYAGGGSAGLSYGYPVIPGSNGGGGTGGAGDPSSGGTAATAGIFNTGGGGGGGSAGTGGGSGGSGTVILRYPTAEVSSFAVTGTLNTPSTVDTIADTAYPIANAAYYKFDGNANDSSGNGYNGTASNVNLNVQGRFGEASAFYVSNSTIVSSSANFTNTQDASVSVWVKDVVAPSSGVSSIYTGSGQDYFYIGVTTSGEIQTYIDNYQDSVYPRTVYQLITVNSNITDGNWHNVVVVSKIGSAASGGGYKIYVDGVLNVAYSYSCSIRRNAGASWISSFGSYATGTVAFNGKLDQTRIFTSAISAANVTLLANEHFQTKFTDGTDSILQFTGGSGDITFS